MPGHGNPDGDSVFVFGVLLAAGLSSWFPLDSWKDADLPVDVKDAMFAVFGSWLLGSERSAAFDRCWSPFALP